MREPFERGEQLLPVLDLLADEDEGLFPTTLKENETGDEVDWHAQDRREDNDTAYELGPAGVVHSGFITLVQGGGREEKRRIYRREKVRCTCCV